MLKTRLVRHSERSEESRFASPFNLRPDYAALSPIPTGAQVLPMAIHRFDEGNLLLSAPAFNLLLTSDGGHDFTENLGVHKSVDVVTCSEPRQKFASVLEHQTFQVAVTPVYSVRDLLAMM